MLGTMAGCRRTLKSTRMCGRVIQSSGPLHYAFVEGMNVRDGRVHNYPPRWNAAPSQDLLVIRHNHRMGLIPHWCSDPTGGFQTLELGAARWPLTMACLTIVNMACLTILKEIFQTSSASRSASCSPGAPIDFRQRCALDV
jgi:hypothetical protein